VNFLFALPAASDAIFIRPDEDVGTELDLTVVVLGDDVAAALGTGE